MSTAFTSGMAGDLEGFLAFKHTLGYAYHRAEFTLRAFDRFLVEHEGRHGMRVRLDVLMLSWLGRSSTRKPVSVACEEELSNVVDRRVIKRRPSGASVWS